MLTVGKKTEVGTLKEENHLPKTYSCENFIYNFQALYRTVIFIKNMKITYSSTNNFHDDLNNH